MDDRGRCPECGSATLYRSRTPIGSGGGHAPNYLPGLGTFWRGGRFRVVLCADCGLTRFYAQPESREKLETSTHWERIG